MKKIIQSSFFLFFSVLCSSVFAGQGVTTSKTILDNGLTVLVSPMPSSSMVSVYGLVKTGSATEGKYLGAGLSHFMEHMLFKGTERRGVGDIPLEVQSLGGTINASTNFDYTIYTLTVPADHFEQAMDILSDMLMHAKFDPQEITREREVVFREMKMHEDEPERYLSDRVFQTAYIRHPYRLPVIGYEDLLRPLTREDFLNYYQLHYTPNNMILSIAGAVDEKTVSSMAKKYFGKYPRGKYYLRQLPAEPLPLSPRYHEEYHATELVRMSVSYPGVSVLNQDMVALDALAIILGRGRGSRLHRALVQDQKIVHSVSAMNFTPQDRGLFEIEISSEKDNIDEILPAMDEQIGRLIKRGVSKAELQKTVSSAVKDILMGQLESGGMAYRTAVDEAVAGQYDFSQWYAKAFQKLTPRDIQRVAEHYLCADRRVVVVLKPNAMRPDETRVDARQDIKPIKRIVLKNGLTVLLREDHSLPLIWVNLVLNGGVYADPEGKEGLSSFMAGLWARGSQRFSDEKIAQITEEKGVSLAGFSGTNSFGLKMNLMSRDADFAWDLFTDVLLHPTFSKKIFSKEKERKKISIKAKKDDISYVGSLELYKTLFDGNPLGSPSGGTVESVERISRDDVVDFYHTRVTPKNAVLSVFGDFKPDALVQKLERYFQNWQGDAPALRTTSLKPVGRKIYLEAAVDKKDTEVFFGTQAEGFHSPDRYGLELLGAIIGYPFHGKMFSIIRDKQALAYTLGGGFEPSRDAGAYVFKVLTAPENLEPVRQSFEEIIQDVRENGVTDEDLKYMKAYLLGRYQRSIDTSAELSFSTALDELYGFGFDDYLKYPERIQAVTPEEIKRLAERYLNPDHMVVVAVKPEKGRK